MTDTEQTTQREYGEFQGEVKWFNNKRGYGFLKVISETRNGEDVFVHQSNINPSSSQYRALYAGEYVAFGISDEDRAQAMNVTGINGGPLRCDAPQPPRFTTVNGSGGRGSGRGRGGNRSYGGRGRGQGQSEE